MYYFVQVVRLKFATKFIKLIKITNVLCVAVYAAVVMFLWFALRKKNMLMICLLHFYTPFNDFLFVA